MRILFAAFLVLAVAGCGFQLRADFSFPPEMQSTFVDYRGADGETLRTVVRALGLTDITVVEDPSQAGAVLVLPSVAIVRRVLLKDLQGRPNEYEIVVTLHYSVTNMEGAILVPPGEVTRRTNLELDPSDPLARAGNIDRAVKNLREDAIWQMLQQISNASSAIESAE